MEPLQFNISERKIQPVVLEGKDGQQTTWELREMLASERDAHLSSLSRRMTFSKDGKNGVVTEFKDLHADLICRCLFRVDPGGPEHNKPITRADVAGWPASASQQVYKAAQDLNKVNEEDGEATEKNE